MSKPAKPRKPVVQLEQLGDGLRLVYRKRDGAGCFLLFWLTGWTVGCIFLAHQAIFGNEPWLWLFGIPFWASWVFVFCLVIYMFFKREVLELDRDGVRFTRSALMRLQYREVPLDELRGFTSKWYAGNNDSHERGIEVTTIGQPFHFARQIDSHEAAWLLDELNGQLKQLRPDRDYRRSEETRAQVVAELTGPAESVTVLRSSSQPVPAPSDNRWQREDDFDGIAFVNRGRWSFAAVGGLLFINLFWNGIVSVFVGSLFGFGPANQGGPQGWEWWGLFVFLIPFEAIGLTMFVGLLMAVFAPFSRTTWTLGMREIYCRVRWFGIGPTWTYPVMNLERLELRQSESAIARRMGVRPSATTASSTPEPGQYALAVIETPNVDLCEIRHLTEGEARYIADVLLRERPEWFR